jgi:hypothetical protein
VQVALGFALVKGHLLVLTFLLLVVAVVVAVLHLQAMAQVVAVLAVIAHRLEHLGVEQVQNQHLVYLLELVTQSQ